MVFSSIVFLFFFLPLVLIGNFSLKGSWRNYFIFFASLIFYSWLDLDLHWPGLFESLRNNRLLILMLTSISINYIGGYSIGLLKSKAVLGLFIVLNLSLLIHYKYYNFFIANLIDAGVLESDQHTQIILPIGISFFTFQGISYLVDVYRKPTLLEKNPVNVGLYIALFPQLIAGPIVRYEDIAKQIKHRIIDLEIVQSGILKFIRGLFKKVIIANTAAEITNSIMNSEIESIPTELAWIGMLAFAIQIYFDFSGYSDMAIGLGRMMGFRIKENFAHPYTAISIKDFWRRWHISLSSWFKDYLYIPLGGNRKGKLLTYTNLIIVFFLTGLWHGASWNFVLWGMIHGFFLIFERLIKFENLSIPKIIKWIYMIMVVLVSWLFFRLHSLDQVILYMKGLCGLGSGQNFEPYLLLNSFSIAIMIVSLIFCTPLRKHIEVKFQNIKESLRFLSIQYLVYFLVFVWVVANLSVEKYNPFIYFQF